MTRVSGVCVCGGGGGRGLRGGVAPPGAKWETSIIPGLKHGGFLTVELMAYDLIMNNAIPSVLHTLLENGLRNATFLTPWLQVSIKNRLVAAYFLQQQQNKKRARSNSHASMTMHFLSSDKVCRLQATDSINISANTHREMELLEVEGKGCHVCVHTPLAQPS